MAEVEVRRRDAKAMSTPKLDPKLSQQKRRELLLDWQKCRRDEIVENLRSLMDEAGASESDGEDIDFLEAVNVTAIKKPGRSTSNQNQANAANGQCVVKPGHTKGRGRTSGSVAHNVEEMEVSVPHGRGRGRGDLVLKVADMDTNWRTKEPTTSSAQMEVESLPYKYRRNNKRSIPYGIMLSEWFADVPPNFEKDWLGVLCPVGRRCVVIAYRGKTKVFTRRNQYLGQFASCLPGGNRALRYSVSGNRRRGVTILDCIWSVKAQMFYVLDLICWNSHSVNNCATDFRHFFLLSKFQETPELGELTLDNAVPFLPLPFFATEELEAIMNTTYPAFPDEIDGVLFYHKNVFYIPDMTPLVLWVHLSDITTVLSVNVNPDLLARECRLDPRKRYYLEKPKYEKVATRRDDVVDTEEANEVCDENGVPLG